MTGLSWHDKHVSVSNALVPMQMQAQEAEQRAEVVEEAVKQPARNAVKLYITSALTAVLSFVVVSGMCLCPCSGLLFLLHADPFSGCALQRQLSATPSPH